MDSLRRWSFPSLLLLVVGCSSDAAPAREDDPGNLGEDAATASVKDASLRDAFSAVDAGMDERQPEPGPIDAATTKDSGVVDTVTPGDARAEIPPELEHFSFFVTSLKAMQELSKSEKGFGGDLRFGETGDGAGLRGADKICSTIAEKSMPGASAKTWRAFLSTVKGGANGGPVNAADRIGKGPWYDRLGRLVSNNLTDLLQVRPASADATIKNDLPNEDGVPNHDPDGTGQVDNHDILTGSDDKGQLYKSDVKVTCNDWTKSEGVSSDAPRVGHSWPRRMGGGGGGFGGMNSENWMSALDEAGCGAGVNLVETGPPREQDPTVGSGGGYGGIYCFALTP
jgi:hypothetical protein